MQKRTVLLAIIQTHLIQGTDIVTFNTYEGNLDLYAYEDIHQDYNEETHKLALSISKPEKQNELQSQGKTPSGEKKTRRFLGSEIA